MLTTSGTDALEMCAMLCDLQAGDEVIIPSYTFVSTALAFLREGAKVVFADSMQRNPNLDAETLEALITPEQGLSCLYIMQALLVIWMLLWM